MQTLTDKLELSLIVPAYNEASTLGRNIRLVEKAALQITNSYELIIAEDGCVDETARVAADISKSCSRVMHLHSDRRLGKGLALKTALEVSKGKVFVFMDADLATDINHLHEVVKWIKSGYDAVIGSRYVKGACVNRPLLRIIASRVYNLLVQVLLRDNVFDHQCGFKGFTRQSLKETINEVVENGFLFDTELIVRMKKKGLRVMEVPVKWKEPEDRISRFNLLADGIKMGLKLIKLRFRLSMYRK